MSIGNLIIIIFILMYIRYFFGFLDRDNIKKIKQNNINMNILRKVPLKTIEQQKEFIELRYPKSKFKFKWKMIWESIPILVMYYGLYRLLEYLFEISKLNIRLWQAVLVIMIFPVLINLILKKFDVQKPDVLLYFR